MSKLIARLMAYLPSIRSHKDLNDAYLNEAVDIYDLERRMRTVDGRVQGRATHIWIPGMEGR